MKKKRSLLRSIVIFVAIIVAIMIYAIAFSVTDVDFEATRSEERLTRLRHTTRRNARSITALWRRPKAMVSRRW